MSTVNKLNAPQQDAAGAAMEGRRETFAAIAAALAARRSRSGLPGIWHVVVNTPGPDGRTEQFRAVYGPNRQYMEVDAELRHLGFGSWRALRSQAGPSFEVNVQRPLLIGDECAMVQVHFTGRMTDGTSYDGLAEQTIYDMNGVPLATVTATVSAHRLDPVAFL